MTLDAVELKSKNVDGFAVCPHLLYRVNARHFDVPCRLFDSKEEASGFLASEVEYARVDPEPPRHPNEGIPPEVEAQARFGKVTKAGVAKITSVRRAELKQIQADVEKRKQDVRKDTLRDQPFTNRGAGWGEPTPIHSLEVHVGEPPTKTFQCSTPIGSVAASLCLTTVADAVQRAVSEHPLPYRCYLADDWRFDDIWKKARELPGFQYQGATHQSIGDILLRALYEVERVFHRFHPIISASATADFWRSWQVHSHLTRYAIEVGESPVARSIVGNFYETEEQARRAAAYISWRMAAFAAELDIGYGEASPAMPRPNGPSTYPNRVSWLRNALDCRGWKPPRPRDFDGPSPKIVRKILLAEPVQEETLAKLAYALSQSKFPVKRKDIPND